MQSRHRVTTHKAAGVTLLTAAVLAVSGALLAAESVSVASLPAASPPAMPAAASDLLIGGQEVPAVTTQATAHCSIMVGDDRGVTGGIETSNIDATAVHIHEGAAGSNGPILVVLSKTSATQWSVPAGTTLTPAQYESYKAGNLYVNVDSVGHVNGEIRAQIRAH